VAPEVEVEADFETGFGTNGIFFFEDFMTAVLLVFFDKFVGGSTPEIRRELIMFSRALTAGSLTTVVVLGTFSSNPLTIWQVAKIA
jgi:hypothetical protein